MNSHARYQRLDQLSRYENLLLLQGPNGPFFRRLALRLTSLGAKVTKVNFNGGDSFFYRDKSAIHYRGTREEWSTFVRDLMFERSIKALVLFGQWRSIHQTAIGIARQLGVKVFVFEEGYARPWWITLEEGGVNDASALVDVDPEKLPAYPQIARPERFRFAFSRMALYSLTYFAFGTLARKQYPHYEHHKPFRPRDTLLWVRSAYLKTKQHFVEKRTIGSLLDAYGPDFFLVPLQINTDAQIVHASNWTGNREFIEATIRSFAQHATSTDVLVFKHHPLERGHADYAPLIQAIAADENVTKRVLYIHGGHVPSLLKRSKGVVTVNSTAGLQALYHGTPLCVTGTAFYARPALVHESDPDKFWQAPVEPNRSSFTRFYRYMMHTTQINASFYVADDLIPSGILRRTMRVVTKLAGSAAALAVFDSGGAFAVTKVFTGWFARLLQTLN
ncbi:capsule polysaccharide biosynthesis/export protein [Caballeronia temeraria]|uniref:Capsule polysaccharide biosynthesis/export protein n=1 Tax=Caballeronia temeraria TaxID=1777137 RepID=A0A158CGQ4_9BURK|nr:capsular biosynthesis protein [Caballeronia temeraria]SAK81553.1 capsule polysaccharide biosynthesis/export protein [Caballeronia temeraria]